MNWEDGLLIAVDKPLEWTSFDVVNKIKWVFRKAEIKTKVGHCGTLDPLATGLLLICTGKKTKQIEALTGLDKEYTGTIMLGASTPSYDRETEVDQTAEWQHLSADRIRDAAKRFMGEQQQLPPVYSAIKVNGRPMYKSARAGKEVQRLPRRVVISAFDILQIEGPLLRFRVVCSKGTYIRSLAHDLGAALACGAHLHSLRRTKIGPHEVSSALSVEQTAEWLRSGLEASKGGTDL